MDLLKTWNSLPHGGGGKLRLKAGRQDKGLIDVDEYGRVYWIGESYQDYKYSDVERLAKQGNLLFIDETLFLWEFPVEMFKAFKEVYVLTYLFKGSALCPFFQ